MVLKRFLNEKAQSKDQDKVALPIKVTRSVGLQVVLASSVSTYNKCKHNLFLVCLQIMLSETKEEDELGLQVFLLVFPIFSWVVVLFYIFCVILDERTIIDGLEG